MHQSSNVGSFIENQNGEGIVCIFLNFKISFRNRQEDIPQETETLQPLIDE